MSVPATYAWRAIRYTQSVLGVRPANHFIERVTSLGGSQECVARVRAVHRDHDRIMNIRRLAGSAKARRCGNCGEYAAVTFDYLMLTHCPHAIEYAAYVDPGDHNFVVIARPIDTDAGVVGTWGPEAVIADAWAGKVVAASRYWIDMPQFPSAVHAPRISARYHAVGDFPAVSPRTITA